MSLSSKLNRNRYILGVRFDNTDSEESLGLIERIVSSRNGLPAHRAFFTNVHTIYLARRSQRFRYIVNQADMVLPDGSGLKVAGKLFGEPIRENLNGTDFMPKVLARAEQKAWTVYLLGGRQGVVVRAAHQLAVRFPNLRIVGTHPGFFSGVEEQLIVDDINRKKPDLLLVALGSPLQEEWVARHAHELRVAMCFAVGGLFDFLSGEKRRAPIWMRRMGLEWVFRFFHDPVEKWKRVIVEIPIFLALVLAKRFVPRSVQDFIARLRVAR